MSKNDKSTDREMIVDTEETITNPWADPSKLFVSQDYDLQMPTKRLITTIKIGRPNVQYFFRCHPDSSYHQKAWCLKDEDTGLLYVVYPQPDLIERLERFLHLRQLYYLATKGGSLCLWPVSAQTQGNAYVDGAHRTCEEAKQRWVSVSQNSERTGYETRFPEKPLAEPVWPELTIGEVMEKAFEDRIISDENHPVVQKILGAA